jgi:hypothetical protein
MNAQQIESLMKWQQEQPESRVLKIEFSRMTAGKPAWVYDYNLGKGQLVEDASEIHLEENVSA